MTALLEVRIGDRTHGATLGECEQWAGEVADMRKNIAQLEAINADLVEAFNDIIRVFDGRQAYYMPLMPDGAPRQFETLMPEPLVEAGRKVLGGE